MNARRWLGGLVSAGFVTTLAAVAYGQVPSSPQPTPPSAAAPAPAKAPAKAPANAPARPAPTPPAPPAPVTRSIVVLVRDSVSGRGIPNATVKAGEILAVSDADGLATLTGVAAGDAVLEISAPEFQSGTLTVLAADSLSRISLAPTAPVTAPAPTPAPEPAPAPEPIPEPAPQPSIDEQILAQAEAEEAEGEVIVVTGSRIGADPLDKQAPVLQLGREAIERTGLTSVGDILQQLPMSGGAINSKFNSSGNFGFPPDGGGIGAGAIEADLHYLGSKRVLVLVDGVRWVNGSSASGVSSATDLNTIPLGIIERIEVLQDGASPIYGSDAIAGVINIITRKRFEGVSANLYTGGYASDGDGFTQKYDMTWGTNTDKMSVVVSASYLDQREVLSKDRELSDSPIPGLDNCEAGCSSATPQGRLVFTHPTTMEDYNITLNDRATLPPFGTPIDIPSLYHPFTSKDRFNFSPFNLVQTPSQRLGVFTGLTYRLPHRINFRGKASFTNRKSANQAAPEPLFIGPEGGNGNRLDRISIHASNPYNPFGFTFDAATNAYVVTRRPLEAGPRRFEQNVNTLFTSGGFDGAFNLGERRFLWDANLAYGFNRADQSRNNAFNSAKLQQALGPAYLDGGGVYRCGTASNPGDPNCVPFNIFGGQGADGRGTITQEMLDYVTFVQRDASEQRLTNLSGNISGELSHLPAGALSMAVGVEHRRLNGFFEPDAVVTAGDGADVPAQPTSGKYSVTEGYVELRAPLLAGKPGAELIDVNAAARVSKYSFLDSAELTYKAGGRYKPTKDLVLRASYGLGFRAPGIGELFGSQSRFDAMLTDPCSDFNRMEVSEAVRQRCIALGVPADGSYSQLNPQISVTTGGNRDLEPETSTSLNLSVAFSPAALKGKTWSESLDLELTYWSIALDGAIAPLDAQLQLDRCVVGGNDEACKSIKRQATGTIFAFGNQLQNVAGIDTSGVDIALTYVMPRKPFGQFRITSQSSYLIEYAQKDPSENGFETTQLEGTVAGEPERAFPRLKSSLTIDWFFGEWMVGLTNRYISSVTEQCRDLAAFDNTCSDPDPDDDTKSTNELGTTVYTDVTATWRPKSLPDLTVSAGVNNLLNIDPPTCYSCALNGFNGTTYDVPGTFGYLSASYTLQ